MKIIDILLYSLTKDQSIINKQQKEQDKLYIISHPQPNKTPFFTVTNSIPFSVSMTITKINGYKGVIIHGK